MCRVYETKNGPFTRLCYRTGSRGERMAGRHVKDWQCVLRGRITKAVRKVTTGPMLLPCEACRGPVSKHDRICSLCREGK